MRSSANLLNLFHCCWAFFFFCDLNVLIVICWIQRSVFFVRFFLLGLRLEAPVLSVRIQHRHELWKCHSMRVNSYTAMSSHCSTAGVRGCLFGEFQWTSRSKLSCEPGFRTRGLRFNCRRFPWQRWKWLRTSRGIRQISRLWNIYFPVVVFFFVILIRVFLCKQKIRWGDAYTNATKKRVGKSCRFRISPNL